MTTTDIHAAIDNGLSALWPAIVARQDAYRVEHGQYFQGLLSHSEIPADGAEQSPDRLDAHPGYQPVTWRDLAGDIFPDTTMSAIEVHQYESAGGIGWVMYMRVVITAQVWCRAVGYGPEDRNKAWEMESPPDL